MKKGSVVLCLAIAVVSTRVHAVEAGDLAPDFTLQDVSGATHSLAAQRGNVVLLSLFNWG